MKNFFFINNILLIVTDSDSLNDKQSIDSFLLESILQITDHVVYVAREPMTLSDQAIINDFSKRENICQLTVIHNLINCSTFTDLAEASVSIIFCK